MKDKYPARTAGDLRNVVFTQPDPVLKAIRDGKSHIIMKNCTVSPQVKHQRPLSFIMLHAPFREYIIKAVKAPLMKAIILAAKQLPKATMDNTYYHNTHVLMGIFDKFFKHFCNSSRLEMMQAGRDILLAEVEHDIHYAWILNWFAKEIADEVNKGNWKLNDEEFPIPNCWIETTTCTGKNTDDNGGKNV